MDTEIAKHILSKGATPIHLIEVPGLASGMNEQQIARSVAELCHLPAPHEAYIAAATPVIQQVGKRQMLGDFVQPFHDHGLRALQQEDLRRVLQRLAQNLDERVALVRQAALSPGTVPAYNKNFSGRIQELLDLRQLLADDRTGVICGLHGLGGIGKTELAYTYAHAFAHAYPGGRYLIECDGKSSLRDALLRTDRFTALFREHISEQERMTPETYLAALLTQLAQHLARAGRTLLVLDNVTAPGLLTAQQLDALTALGPSLHLLATTRITPPAAGKWITLGELQPQEALDLLEKHRAFASESERAAAQRIVRRLGGFALAIELVAAWLRQHEGASYASIAESIGLEDLEHIAQEPDIELRRHNHERRLSAVLGPSLILSTEPGQGLTAAERRTLEYAALLPPDHVPLPWLKTLVTQDHPELLQATRLIADPWQDLIHRLQRLALLTRAEGETTTPRLLRIHRAVQLVLRNMMSPEELAQRQQAVDTLIEQRNAALEQTTRWKDARWELEPLEALAFLWADTGHADAAWLLNQAALQLHHLAEWTRAEALIRRAIAIYENSLCKEHPNVATALNILAALLHATNRLAEAEPLMRRALAIREARHGPVHSEVATDLNNLAALLKDTNRLAEAEPLMRRALAIQEASHGPMHSEVASYLNNIARLLQATNRFAEAEPLMRRALAIDEASYGPEHPAVARDLNNLVLLLQDTNRLVEAEPLIRRALAIHEASYGPEHPTVAIYLHNLARLLQSTNRLAEAEPLMARAVTIIEKSLGAEHPNVATALSNLAQLLKATNRLAEAEPLMRRALAIHEASHGPVHSEITIYLNNLARLLQATNRLAEAAPLLRRTVIIVAKFTAQTGHQHPHLQTFCRNYEHLLRQSGQTESQAHEQLRSALAEGGLRLG